MAHMFKQTPPANIRIEILPDPLTMQEIEYYPDGRVKHVIFKPFDEMVKAFRETPKATLQSIMVAYRDPNETASAT